MFLSNDCVYPLLFNMYKKYFLRVLNYKSTEIQLFGSIFPNYRLHTNNITETRLLVSFRVFHLCLNVVESTIFETCIIYFFLHFNVNDNSENLAKF